MSEKRIPVIIDCDPGCDDTAALLLAFRCPEFDIRAVTTVSGNVSLDKTTYNALRVTEAIGSDVRVCPGADRPMFRDAVYAPHVHGEDGLLGIPLPAPQKKASFYKAWDFIYEEAVAQKGELELIAVGPLTNLASPWGSIVTWQSASSALSSWAGPPKGETSPPAPSLTSMWTRRPPTWCSAPVSPSVSVAWT